MNTDKLITVDQISSAIKKAAEGAKGNRAFMKSYPHYLELVHTYVNRVVTAKDKGKWVVAHSTQVPVEIFEAMDCVGVFNELWGVVTDIVNLESVPEALSISASLGTPTEVCSFYRNMDGLMHAGKWPRTDFFVYSPASCNNTKAWHTLARRYGIPEFGMDRPYLPYTRHAMDYWKNEHKRLIAFLEERTGKKLDYDRLKETVRLSYRLTELVLEIDKLVAHVPSPMSCESFGGPLMAVRLMAGTQEALDYMEALKADLEERIANGIAAVKPERFRVMWSAFTPFWDPALMPLMQKKYGAVSVTEILNHFRGDAKWLIAPDDPLECLAYRTQLAPGNVQYSSSIDWATEVVAEARKFSVDGAIANNNWGCKQAAGLGPIVRDELMRHCGVPSVTLNVDVIDPNFISQSAVVGQLDSFFEMIETSKAYKDRRNLK
jgi:benzoyl-CoA reductase/2-hydroxyglutaryl-CoA dehydratase subunit BcrC/BadD/HgdB